MSADGIMPADVAVQVTCPTAGCENEGITIIVFVPDDDAAVIICGVCGADLTSSKVAL